MKGPTDEQIFNHMKPDEEPSCIRCNSEVKRVEYSSYITYQCLLCGFEPSPQEED